MRCLALADALRAVGSRVAFATWPEDLDVVRRIQDAGYDTYPVALPRNRMSPLSEYDANRTAEAVARIAARWVVVDHYRAAPAYLRTLSFRNVEVGVVDDVADRDLTAASWILNPNVAADGLTYQTHSDCTICRGSDYAMLRPAFATARSEMERTFSPDDRKVLITLGGSDVAEPTRAILTALNALSEKLEIRVIVGGPDAAKRLTSDKTASVHDVSVLNGVSDMSEQMAWADVSVNAGGTTCWELCCLGVPMVVCQLSDDQAANVSELTARELAVGLGLWDETSTPKAAVDAVLALLRSPARREEMSRRGMALIDGRGAHRAASSLLSVADRTRETVR